MTDIADPHSTSRAELVRPLPSHSRDRPKMWDGLSSRDRKVRQAEYIVPIDWVKTLDRGLPTAYGVRNA